MSKPKINILVVGENLLGAKKIINLLDNSRDIHISGKFIDDKGLHNKVKGTGDFLILYYSLDIKQTLKTIEYLNTLNLQCKFIIIGSIGTITEIISGIRHGIRAWVGESVCKNYLISVIKSIHNGGFAVITEDAHNLVNIETIKNNYSKNTIGRTDLTEREIEVLTLIAEGASNKIIADVLFISENTAKTHVRNILEKLQIRSRMQAALFAIEKGIKKK